MTKHDITAKILKYIKKNNGVNYAQIEHIFEECDFRYQGSLEEIVSEQYPNIVLWAGWNEEALEILGELLRSGSVVRVPYELLIYMIDGKMLTYPIQKDSRSHSSPHWLPCVFTAKAA